MKNGIDNTPNYITVFETRISGEAARVEVPSVGDPTRSRELRRTLETIARRSFLALSPAGYKLNQAVKVVEILKLTEEGH